jgi:UDP-glucose 4-epimerase
LARCLITGGSGFIGRHLANVLHKRGHTVRVASRSPALRPDDRWPPQIQRQKFDLRDDVSDMHDMLADTDTVFHLAWTSHPTVANRDAALDMENNLVTSLRLLQSAVAHENIRFVFVSSGGYVYGRAKQMPIDEDHPTEPISPYGLSKLTFERYLDVFGQQHGLDYRIVRLSNAFGVGQDISRLQGVVTTFIAEAIRGVAPEIWGDGSVIRDYIHVSDVARALALTGEASSADLGGNRIFNIGSGCGRSLNDVVDVMNQIGLATTPHYHRGRSFDVPVNVLDISRAARILNWRPQLSFSDGLRQTALDLGWNGPRPAYASALSSVTALASSLATVATP